MGKYIGLFKLLTFSIFHLLVTPPNAKRCSGEETPGDNCIREISEERGLQYLQPPHLQGLWKDFPQGKNEYNCVLLISLTFSRPMACPAIPALGCADSRKAFHRSASSMNISYIWSELFTCSKSKER